MKKTLFILFCAPFLTVAQSSNSTQAKYYMNRMYFTGGESTLVDYNGFGSDLSSDQCQEQGVKTVIIERGNKPDKLRRSEYQLTDLGLIASVKRPKETLTYSYEQDSLISTIIRSGKVDYKTKFNYADGKLKKKEVFKEDRLKSRVLMDYGQHDKVSFCLLQSGRKLKTSYTMSYEYDDKKLRRQQFMCNDKIVRIWDYSCEPKGELIDKKKLSTLCKVREENNDGSYTEHIRKIEEGKVLLYTHHYDKDSVNYASSCEKETGEKLWESKISKTERTYTYFSKKGEISRTHVTKFNSDGKIIELTSTFGRKQNKESKTVYKYNENGLITEQESFYKGKPSYMKKYSYVS